MSDIFFTDSSEAPVPPEEVRIREFQAVPRRDGQRVDVHLALTPFQKRPNIEVGILNGKEDEVAALSVVEAIDPKMDFTMHLREPGSGEYNVEVRVFYADIEGSAATNGGNSSAGEILSKAKQVVDRRTIAFEIPQPGP